ncbi:hypothetical protein Dimus_033371 [Dionaea muscipula]
MERFTAERELQDGKIHGRERALVRVMSSLSSAIGASVVGGDMRRRCLTSNCCSAWRLREMEESEIRVGNWMVKLQHTGLGAVSLSARCSFFISVKHTIDKKADCYNPKQIIN